MAQRFVVYPSTLSLDPQHKSCNNGKTILTCRSCAGNPPRGDDCTACQGYGFNVYICAHCQPAAAAAIPASSGSPANKSSSKMKSSQSSGSGHSELGSRHNPRRDGGGSSGGMGGGGGGGSGIGVGSSGGRV